MGGVALGAWVASYLAAGRAQRAAVESARRQAQLEASRDALAEQRHEQDEEIRALRAAKSELEAAAATLRERVLAAERTLAEQKDFVEASRKEMADAFDALAAKALSGSTEEFLKLAEERLRTSREQASHDLDARKQSIEALVAPLRESLGRLEQNTANLEKAREGAYRGLEEQVLGLRRATETLEQKAGSLASALKGSGAQGRWGEIALRNVVELAGMSEHVDFAEQTQVGGKRPDMIVRLPGDRQIAVDAKVSLNDYLAANQAKTEGERDKALDRHVAALKSHVRALASREYADRIPGDVDLVVLFLPGDPFLSAAFERDPDLQADAARQKVLITTPTTLVALLRTVAVYWQQRSVAENAERIAEVARELYERAARFGHHLSRVGSGLETAVDAFNSAVGSFERRFLPMGSRLDELHATDSSRRKLEAPSLVEESPRRVAELETDPLVGRDDDAPETLPLFSAFPEDRAGADSAHDEAR